MPNNAKKVSDDVNIIISFSDSNLLILVPNLTKMSIQNTRFLRNSNVIGFISSETFFIKQSGTKPKQVIKIITDS